MKKDENKQNILKVVGLAVGLPSSILGVFGISFYLVEKSIISKEIALALLISVIVYTFYMMIKYANKK